ncbi:MAG: DegV family EDD domain-containing protein [Lachnospiraceae bacterium]|nr:DegV family EDD domain-containing protein [Lachnospiraceae bacterium]
MMKLIKKLFARLTDFTRSYEERTFIMLSIIGVSAMVIALIFDIIGGESMQEIVTISASIIAIPVLVSLSIRFEKIPIGSFISVCALIFIILPITFYYGGGTRGGGIYWIIFAYMFIGMSLTGRLRVTMMGILTFIGIFEFWSAYRHLEWIYPHSMMMSFLDPLVSVILVGICMYFMLMYQKTIFTEESKRAHAEAERVEELNRSQNRFFSSMSHEIRTPINSILGLNELILRDQDASDDIIKDASGIQGSGKMLLALINDILDFSKIEAGSMDIVPVDYHIGDMLSEIVNMMWLRTHDKGLGFEVSVDPEVPTVLYGDEVRIKQIIINLLNNAVKYTAKGHVGLRVESREAETDKVELMISVSDTGMGIKKEDLPYLFDAFKRVDEGKNRHIEGTGLGLSIVKQLTELMDGTITVNSVYGEGSTFTVMVKQKVSDHNRIGELNIHNQQIVKRNIYESSFLAPEVRILIVDDNEMNLEVERRLLEDTDMGIDVARSGKEALEMCLGIHYDAIFMDHLMPGIDGIECLEALRNQTGGLNRNTPVIVLTANAGSENRELYNQAGFDGYLVKPVSGEAMEEMLIRHISGEKIILRSVLTGDGEEIHTADKYSQKLPVIITSSSMCDLPDSVIRKLHIPIIPFVIKTEEGIFKDGFHMDAYELIKHIGSGKEAVSAPPCEADYTEFFAENLKKAHHLIHIAITTSMSDDFKTASEAAKAFDNVTVINSESISSSMGILVLIAYKLMQQGKQVEDILSELETVKKRLKCSFIINTTEYMAKKGLVSSRLNRIADALNIHPALKIRNDRTDVGGIWLGRTRRAYRKYIKYALPKDTVPDSDILFITYADVLTDVLKWIEEEIQKIAYFEHVVFQQASAAISSNCGPGSFGIFYFLKSNKSYNIASFIDDMNMEESLHEDIEGDENDETAIEEEFMEEYSEAVSDAESYEESNDLDVSDEELSIEDIKGIDTEIAIKNSGSEAAFRTVLKIFYDSIKDKYEELENSFTSSNWENYTIKIHALKSSARLVGAVELGDCAEKLEMAGKGDNIQYIKENHDFVMDEYLSYLEILAPLFESGSSDDSDKPLADEFLMESIYEELRKAAEDMNSDMIDDIMKEIEEYAIPASEKEKFDLICEKADRFDYDGIIEALS